MIKTLAPYNNTARTAEIMSRYRPIAPKPENPEDDHSNKINHSPYFRNLWPQLQARPTTRARKRGRAIVSPPPFKRTRTHHQHLLGMSSSSHVIYSPSRLPFHSFAHAVSQLPIPNTPAFENVPLTAAQVQSDLVTLPLLPTKSEPRGKLVIDLNAAAEVPEEPSPTTNVISPQAIRPVGSTIRVGCISEDPIATSLVQVQKKPEEVEQEVESEKFPAIISDSNYRVRMANSAYKEMVGQPECSWLDSIVTGKRICGEVTLHLATEVPSSSGKFFCWVNIEWGHEGNKETVHAFCDVVRLSCLSKDYLFSWRFHTRGSSSCSSSSQPSGSSA